jgi:hypothetical protein
LVIEYYIGTYLIVDTKNYQFVFSNLNALTNNIFKY